MQKITKISTTNKLMENLQRIFAKYFPEDFLKIK
jgi:hypothetical protein